MILLTPVTSDHKKKMTTCHPNQRLKSNVVNKSDRQTRARRSTRQKTETPRPRKSIRGSQKREKGGQKRVFDPLQPFPYIYKETGFGGSRTPFFVEDSRLLPKTQGELLTLFKNRRAQRRDGQNTRELLTPLEESRLFLVKK